MKAPKAAVLPMLRHARIMTINTGSQIDRTGILCLGLMYENHAGRAPSRDQAQVNRDADAMLPKLTAQEMIRRPQTIAVAAFTEPVACTQISTIGKGAFSTASRSPMQKRMTMMIE